VGSIPISSTRKTPGQSMFSVGLVSVLDWPTRPRDTPGTHQKEPVWSLPVPLRGRELCEIRNLGDPLPVDVPRPPGLFLDAYGLLMILV
jgi:hypothetical protein